MSTGQPRLAVMRLFDSVAQAVDVAVAAEKAGLDAVGIGDSPLLYPDPFVTMSVVVQRTERIAVTPCVTNLVTRHWSTHAGAARAIEEIAPGRSWWTIATGNSAVRMARLAPQRLDEMSAAIAEMRAQAGDELRIMVAAGGPRSAELAGRDGDGILVGSGADADLGRDLIDRAEGARGTDSPSRELQRWLHVLINVAASDRPEHRRAAEDEILNAVIGFARHALRGDHGLAAVPPDLVRPIRSLLQAYDFGAHGRAGARQSNAAILAAQPDREAIRRFLFERFAVVGPPEACAQQISDLTRRCGLDGVSLSIPVLRPVHLVERLGSEVIPRIDASP